MRNLLDSLARLLGYYRPSYTTGPKDFKNIVGIGWEGNGVLADFDKLHGLEILVASMDEEYNETNYEKTWGSDADEVIFRRNKRILLYWR